MLHSELIPAAHKSSRALMIMLHGLGDSMEGYRWFPEAMDLPWMNYLLVNAPDDYYSGFSWYDFAGDMMPGVKRSTELLFAVLEDCEQRGFPSGMTTLGGFSQGCLMSIEVGLRYPKPLAGIVGISGYVCEPEKLIAELSPVAGKQRILMTHGTQDPLIPLAGVRGQVQFLQKAGLRIEWREFVKPHTIAGEEEMAVIRKFVRAGYPDVVSVKP
jgi:phospholipase/carboxylesterase